MPESAAHTCTKHSTFEAYLSSGKFESLNYIKQLGLKDDLPLTLHQTIKVLHPNEYAILSVRVGVWEGLYQVGFQIDLM